jgi:hypothetical protein
MFPQAGENRMRPLPPMPTNLKRPSGSGGGPLLLGVFLHISGMIVEPFPQLFLMKSPLAAYFHGGYFFALGPKTNRTRGNAEPFRHGGSS